jgi:hypothetical protein
MNKNTMTGAGIRLGTSQLNSFARQGVPQSLIVLTDGVSHDDTAVAAAQAFNQGIQIFAVGIGSGINRAELMNIAAQNPAKVHTVDSYAALDGILNEISKELCPLV